MEDEAAHGDGAQGEPKEALLRADPEAKPRGNEPNQPQQSSMTPSNSRVVRGPKVGYLREDADHGGDGGGRRRDTRLGRQAFFPLSSVYGFHGAGRCAICPAVTWLVLGRLRE